MSTDHERTLVEELLESGETALEAGNHATALQRWSAVLATDPDNERALQLMAELELLTSGQQAPIDDGMQISDCFQVVSDDLADTGLDRLGSNNFEAAANSHDDAPEDVEEIELHDDDEIEIHEGALATEGLELVSEESLLSEEDLNEDFDGADVTSPGQRSVTELLQEADGAADYLRRALGLARERANRAEEALRDSIRARLADEERLATELERANNLEAAALEAEQAQRHAQATLLEAQAARQAAAERHAGELHALATSHQNEIEELRSAWQQGVAELEKSHDQELAALATTLENFRQEQEALHAAFEGQKQELLDQLHTTEQARDQALHDKDAQVERLTMQLEAEHALASESALQIQHLRSEIEELRAAVDSSREDAAQSASLHEELNQLRASAGAQHEALEALALALEEAEADAQTLRHQLLAHNGTPGTTHGSLPIVLSDEFEDSSHTTQSSGTLDQTLAMRLVDEELSALDRLSPIVGETPTLTPESRDADISAHAAFVLQNIDGMTSFADLIDIIGLPAEEAASILVQMLVDGIITSPSLAP